LFDIYKFIRLPIKKSDDILILDEYMKVFTGKVISTKMKKTATVAVSRVVIHPVYKKRFRRIKKYHVHDPIGVSDGQGVAFVACKPYSRLKRWKIIKIVKKPANKKLKKQNIKAK
jgi:small subunit ribosomal protein S17